LLSNNEDFLILYNLFEFYTYLCVKEGARSGKQNDSRSKIKALISIRVP
jgi:hypothetical protein